MPKHRMTEENRHINDDFIPDGLEFKNEYFEQAMGMYQREKLILRWRKIGVAAASIAAAVSLLILVFYVNNGKEVIKSNQLSVDQSKDVSSEPQSESSVVNPVMSDADVHSANDIRDEKYSGSSEIESPAKDRNESNHKQVINDRAFVHENVVSSGATSSGSSPNYSGKAPGQRGETSSGVASHVRELVFDDKKSNSPNSSLNESVEESLQTISQEIKQRHELNPAAVHQNDQPKVEEFVIDLKYLPYHSASFESKSVDLKPNMAIEIPKLNRLQLHLGACIGLWADYGRNKESALPAGFFGELGFDYALKAGWSAGLSAHATMINQPSNPVLIENTSYGQGFNTTAQTVLTDHLYYSGAQLSASKRIGLNNQILLGYCFDYLITGDNTISTSQYSSLESFPSSDVKTKGYVAGFKDVNHAMVLEYRRNFGKYYAGFRGQFGLTDITKQGVFLFDNRERNSMITVNLGLKLNT